MENEESRNIEVSKVKSKNESKSGISPEGYLKKQSQFSKGQNDVKSVTIKAYGRFGGF